MTWPQPGSLENSCRVLITPSPTRGSSHLPGNNNNSSSSSSTPSITAEGYASLSCKCDVFMLIGKPRILRNLYWKFNGITIHFHGITIYLSWSRNGALLQLLVEPRYLDLNIGLRRFNFCVDGCVSVCGEAGLGWAGLEGVFSIFDYFRNPMLHTHWALLPLRLRPDPSPEPSPDSNWDLNCLTSQQRKQRIILCI